MEEWANTLNVKVQLWLVKKYVELDNPKSVLYEIPDDARPVLSTIEPPAEAAKGIAQYDVSVFDLINAGFLKAGEKLTMTYKPKKGDRRVYEGTLEPDGSITLLGKTFSSPSFAALYGIQDAGSSRRTVNGWISWRTSSGESLYDLREKYLKKQK